MSSKVDIDFDRYPTRRVRYLSDKPRDAEITILERYTDAQIAAIAPPDAYAFITYYELRGRITFQGRTYDVTTSRFADSPIRYIGGEVFEDKTLFDDGRGASPGLVHSPGSRLIQTRYGLRPLESDAIVLQEV